MKRRVTKKNIQSSERSLRNGVDLYLTHAHDEECDKCEEIFKELICVALMLLLNFKDQLDSPTRTTRWVQNIVLSALSLEAPALLTGRGVVVWGLEGQNGDSEVNESLDVAFHLNKSHTRTLNYSLRLGTSVEAA